MSVPHALYLSLATSKGLNSGFRRSCPCFQDILTIALSLPRSAADSVFLILPVRDRTVKRCETLREECVWESHFLLSYLSYLSYIVVGRLSVVCRSFVRGLVAC